MTNDRNTLKSSAPSFFIGFLSSSKISLLPKKILEKGQLGVPQKNQTRQQEAIMGQIY